MRENDGPPPFGGWNGTLVVPPYTATMLKWGLAIIGVIFLVVVLNILRAIYTDWLWFNNLGFLSVFTTRLWTRIWLFFVGAGLFGVLITVNLVLVRRHARGESVLPLPQETIRWLDRLMVAGIILGAILLSVIFGAIAASEWETILRLANSTAFGTTDPVFQRDVSFFVFTLPVLEMVQGWLLAALIVLLLATGATYFVHYALRGVPFVATPWLRGHLAVLGSLTFVDLAAKHLLDRYGLLFSQRGVVFGATYADINARMPALVFLTAIAVASGILLIVTLLPALRGPRGTRLMIGAGVLWVVATVVAGNLFPTAVQRFIVQPNEFQRDRPFIDRNIVSTRAAFNLDRIKEETITVQKELTADALALNQDTVNNVRLWDPRPVKGAYNRAQFLRRYYTFKDADVDRYSVNGKYRQVLLSARELEQQGLEAQNWVNQRLQYTHGYGAVVSPATEFTTEGQPIFFVKDIPPVSTVDGMDIQRPELYFSESSPEYVIVKSKTTELDYEPKEGSPVYSNYQGSSGVLLSSLWRRLAYAWQFSDVNILISNQVSPESRIQYRRTVQERIHQVAPFLLLDGDPYLVIEDGDLKWVQDAYTTTNRYPYSTPYKGTFNYIRNSVKAVVNAYEGTIVFYVADPEDPIIKTYQRIFPTLFQPREAMSEFLQNHIRYPEDLFSFQAEMYLKYHMRDPNQFFNQADQWDVPEEFFFGNIQPVLPYYVVMKLPGEERPEFVLILPFTPAPTKEKPNMVAWLAARMDKPYYGELVAYSFPRGVEIHGPALVEARIDQNFEIKQDFALLCTGEANCIRGNLLVIPIEDSILYVEPLYLQSANVPFPELKRVILASGTKVVMEPTLAQAVAALVGAPTPVEEQPPVLSEVAQQLERIEEVLEGLKGGLTDLEQALNELAQIVEEGQQ